jgi:glutamate racemase
LHLIITDSGLGGLSICAAIEKLLREATAPDVRITYVNAWPEPGRGYNQLPDMATRARVFDGALHRMAGLAPDEILIACNTLSVIYPRTRFHEDPPVPVHGIVDAGVELFREALASRPESALVLLGTRTTIESGVHRDQLVKLGVAGTRIGAAECHGLATAIEHGPESAATAELIDDCAGRAAQVCAAGQPLYAGLCCTHYAMVSGQICAALKRRTRRVVLPLDPNDRLVRDVASRLAVRPPGSGGGPRVQVEVVSGVELDEAQRQAVGVLIDPVSPVTAEALRTYRYVPDFFSSSS